MHACAHAGLCSRLGMYEQRQRMHGDEGGHWGCTFWPHRHVRLPADEQSILVQVSKHANMAMIMCEQSAQGSSAGPVMCRRMREPGCAVSTAPRPEWTS